jgi:hypothetical protein
MPGEPKRGAAEQKYRLEEGKRPGIVVRAHKHNGCSPVRIPYVLRSGVASRGRWGAAAASPDGCAAIFPPLRRPSAAAQLPVR